jgi:hypothetical protein
MSRGNSVSRKSKESAGKTVAARESVSGRFLGLIDDADAKRFRQANNALLKEVAGSKAKAVEVLKESGYLTSTGKVAKRYR